MMANLFDAANAPSTEPASFVAGDFVQWKRDDLISDYPIASYSAQYVSRLTAGGATEFLVVASESLGGYLFTIPSATSATYPKGLYHWQLEIVRTSDSSRIVLQRGDWEIKTDLDDVGADPRSHARIMLTKIESILSGRADSDVANYSIAGRSISKMTFAELIEARDYYRQEYANEQRAERIAAGKPSGATIKVRFT